MTAETQEEQPQQEQNAPARTVVAAALKVPRAAVTTPLRTRLTLARLVLAAALAGGAALRFVGLGRVGLNSDEAVYAAQAASLAKNPHFTAIFPVVRAHPLLVQMLASPLYAAGRPDTVGRYIVAAFGLGTVGLVYLAGRILYGARVGAAAALLLAVMPYHVMLSRQFLLDGPMTFFTTAALVCIAKAVKSAAPRWFVAAGACLGAAALCKETGLVLAVAALVFLCVYARAWRPRRYIVAAGAVTLALTAAYPAITAHAGGGRGGHSYLLWQLTRQPNHDFGFYPAIVGAAVGFVLLVVAAVGLLIRRPNSWRETLLLSWILVPVAYFELWPVKGFAYLLPIAPALALVAARGIGAIAHIGPAVRRRVSTGLSVAFAVVCTAMLVVPAAQSLAGTPRGLAGAGGTPGGRETGQWIATHVPPTARMITIGPSMANLIRYYSGRRADGLSVSPNPLHRNPSYEPIINPDAALRDGTYQYIVWDAVSADRSNRFSQQASSLASRFHARTVHVERASDGRALVAVYRVQVAHTRYGIANPAPTATVRQPGSTTLYIDYSLCCAFVLAILGWAAVPRRRRAKEGTS